MIISIHFNPDLAEYTLMVADGKMRAMPAGPWLFHIPKNPKPTYRLPAIAFVSDTLSGAERSATKLREYLDGLGAKKGKKGADESDDPDAGRMFCAACKKGPLFLWDRHERKGETFCPGCAEGEA